MYRLFLLVSMILICSLCLYLELNWYFLSLGGAIFGFLFPVWRRGGFYYPFLAAIMVWGCYAGYLHVGSEGRLGDRLAMTFGVGTGWVLVVVTALWGGITAGLGGLLGASLRIGFQGGKK